MTFNLYLIHHVVKKEEEQYQLNYLKVNYKWAQGKCFI